MPKPAKPWWDATKKQWACRHRGVYTPLGKGTRDAATREFHRLKAAGETAMAPVNCTTVGEVLEEFLAFIRANKADATYRLAESTAREFDAWLGSDADIPVVEFRPALLQRWLDDQPKRIKIRNPRKGKPAFREVVWTNNTKRLKARYIVQAFNYAAKMGLIDRNPLAAFTKPPATRREGVVPPDVWTALLGLFAVDDPFRVLLEFCRLTGSRPQEVRAIESRHLSADFRAVTFPASEGKKKRPRTIHLSTAASVITKDHAGRRTTGPIFRNSDGQPWGRNAIRCRMRTAKARLTKAGVHIDQLYLGIVRKTWETDALKRVPLALVAELAGHDPKTALTYYAHLQSQTQAMRDAAELASGSVAPE